MKYSTYLAALVALVGATVFGGEVSVDADSVETLGMNKPAKEEYGEIILGVPFVKSPTSGTNTVDTLFFAGWENRDQIRIWNPTATTRDKYDTWSWNRNAHYWRPTPKTETQVAPPAASDYEVPQGYAFWFADRSGSSIDLVQAGLVKPDAATKVCPGTAAHPINTAMINPYGMECDLKALIATEVPAEDDQITGIAMPDDTTSPTVYTYKTGKGWCVLKPGPIIKILPSGQKIRGPSTYEPVETIILRAGRAFWYVSKGATDVTFRW